MQISIANVIQVARRIGAAAAEVITTNLKMWLGFETSETLGREEVVNGDFATDLNSWDISGTDATHTVTYSNGSARYQSDSVTPQLNFDQTISNVELGKTYQLSIDVTYTTGSLKVASIDANQTVLSEGLNVFNVVANSKTIRILRSANIVDALINSVSVKELTQITPDKSGNNNVGELFTGKALEFDGSTSYVAADGFAGTLSDNTAFTIVMWFKSNQVSQAQPYQNIQMSGLKSDGASNVFKFGASANSTLKGIHYQDTAGPSNNYKINDTVNYNDDIWYRLVITRRFGTNPQTANFYVDGVNIGSCPSQIVWSDLAKFSIGQEYDSGNTPSDFFKGLISDVQIYDKDWLQADITYDYANPQNLVTDRDGTLIALSNLKGYWAMSEGAGSLVYDSSGEGNNGTINGATYEPALPRIPQLGMMSWSLSTPVADEITLIPNPNNPSQDILGKGVRDRLNSFNLGKFGGARVDAFTLSGNQATIQLWFKNVNSNDSLYLADLRSVTDRIVLGFESSQLSVFHGITGSWQNFGVITDGDWNFATFTFDGTSLKCFVGTSQLGVTKTISAINLNTTIQFGVGMNHNFPTRTQDYNGHISDFLIYDRVLTSDEIENNYNAGLATHS